MTWLAGLVFFLLAGCDSISADADDSVTDTITVMTRNMYVPLLIFPLSEAARP